MILMTSNISTQIDDLLSKLIDTGVDVGGRILGAIIIFLIGRLLVGWLNKLFAKLLVKQKVEPGVQTFLKSMVNILLMLMLALAIIGKLGIELTGFAALLASAGMAVGMALSGQLQNFAGGIIILVFRPFKVGDYIESDAGAAGTVQEIQIFHTVLVTPDNKVVYAPNGTMSNAVCTNYSHKTERRLDFTVSIEYGADYKYVESVIREILEADERIMKTPAPFIELGKLSDNSVDITVRVWVKASDYWTVHFQTNQAIYTTFNERGISFPYPQIVVHQGEANA